MQPGETVCRSTLDKPLHQLTEDDISQITREDCRRYLKKKGMRRPSWNKSQAIQQVISLKTLLEATPETESPRPRPYIPRPPPHPPDSSPSVPPNSSVSARGASADTPISVSADELVTYRQHDPPYPDVSADSLPPVHAAAAENDPVSPSQVSDDDYRIDGFVIQVSDDDYSANAGMFDSNVDSVCLLLVWINITTGMAIESAGQMTIFYCGKVNVYDDVPRDKAQAIMHLAASPFAPPQDASSDVIPTLRPFQCQLETPGVKAAPNSIVANFPTPPTVKGADNGKLPWEESSIAREDNLEGSTSRKASLQRYFEKKKDRFRNKRKVAMPSASSDIFSSHRVGDQISNDHWNLSDACSPPQPRPPQTPIRCNSADDVAKNGTLKADLNDKDVPEI
ncbi:hypothetical protein SADUNF_Sadunf05G0158600 [Salix dunnii]|uniref:Protein TIFY n=1 Tax=Salix dunnii TaxID=1413687 RepID=A0A835N2D0_9ROSI|nr:hypothetical protein SADUNF_Sadunf05G0158600 [Salix dunnii]